MKPDTFLENFLYTTVRLEVDLSEGRAGCGTGFVLEYRLDERRHLLFLVTNKHVVRDAEKIEMLFCGQSGGKPSEEERIRVVMPSFGNAWLDHPDEHVDVTLFPMSDLVNKLCAAGRPPFFRAYDWESLPSDEEIREKLDAVEDVIIIGYPSGIYDVQNLLPIVRKGITATPVSVDFSGSCHFLIDASVFPGSSGSPVLLYKAGSYSQRGLAMLGGPTMMLLGIVSDVYYRMQDLEVVAEPVPVSTVTSLQTKQMIDLALVVKARAIREVAAPYIEAWKAAKNATDAEKVDG